MARTEAAVEELTTRIVGSVLTPRSPDYQAASLPWNMSFQQRPGVIVQAVTVADVVEAVRYAGSNGLAVAVQATGHGVTTPSDDETLLILTRGLKGVAIDPDPRVATVGGGETWTPVLDAAQDVGLAPLLGSTPHSGAVGYTLGGGFGWLGRRYGLAADHVRSFTVVLADGSVVRTSGDSEPELFWALKGAGSGSLGVVVEMETGLVPVSSVYGGNLFYPVEDADKVFDFYSSWSEGLPDEFTTAFDIFNFPHHEMVPAPLRGRAFAIVRGCHCGEEREAEALVDAWRTWRSPEIDMFGPMSFRDIATVSQDPVEPLPALTSARWLTDLSDDVFKAMIEVVLGGEGPSPILFTGTRHGGGALSRQASEASYLAPDADRLVQVVAVTPGPEAREDAERRVQGLWRRLGPLVDSVYLNLTEGEERLSQTRNAFDFASWTRLVAVKQHVDPENLFSHGIDLSS
jgi:FAD/FMN-containing dehydrogenase